MRAFQRGLRRLLAVFGAATLLQFAGCDFAGSLTPEGLLTFAQDFARQVLAAFLF